MEAFTSHNNIRHCKEIEKAGSPRYTDQKSLRIERIEKNFYGRYKEELSDAIAGIDRADY